MVTVRVMVRALPEAFRDAEPARGTLARSCDRYELEVWMMYELSTSKQA